MRPNALVEARSPNIRLHYFIIHTEPYMDFLEIVDTRTFSIHTMCL